MTEKQEECMTNKIEIPKRTLKTKGTVGQIYIIRNLINDKVYIGETTMGYKERFAQHCKRSTRTSRHFKLYEAMNTLGLKNFYVELLEDRVPIDKMYEREIFYIKKYNSFYNGYNSTKGGDGRLINTKENIKYIIEAYKKGLTSTEIAKKYNVNGATIVRTLHRYNVPTRPEGSKIPLLDKDLFIKMWNEGVIISHLAKYFNINEKSVRRYVIKFKLSPRGKGGRKKREIFVLNLILLHRSLRLKGRERNIFGNLFTMSTEESATG